MLKMAQDSTTSNSPELDVVLCSILSLFLYSTLKVNYLCGVIMSMFAVSVIVCFDPLSGRTKDYKFGNCCFSTNYAELRLVSS